MDQALKSFIATLAPGKKRQILRKMANSLKSMNQKRMARQVDPDGEAWEKRKSAPRAGRPNKMMAGLRKKIAIDVGRDSAEIGFKGRTGKIALIHHEGLSDAVSDGGPKIRYQMRRLIGVTGGDMAALEALILQNL
jgi:phage virion morphogenesis protein